MSHEVASAFAPIVSIVLVAVLIVLVLKIVIVLKFTINMYALVQFYDDIYYVCKSNRITTTKNITKATYSDGRNYAANIIAKNG